MRLFDAHNHLHDARLRAHRQEIARDLMISPLAGMVINGTCRADWDEVAFISSITPGAIPAFGYHPWFLDQLPQHWEDDLQSYLTRHLACVGEIGIDHWKPGVDRPLQERVFLGQLEIARERRLPITIHGLKAWGRLLQLLQDIAPLPCGFLLHSYAGPPEFIGPFAALGGYFSCSGAALHPKRIKTLQLFAQVPEEALLVESDAPDQTAPADDDPYKLVEESSGERLTHPLTVEATYFRLAQVRGVEVEDLCNSVERNFNRLFARVLNPVPQA